MGGVRRRRCAKERCAHLVCRAEALDQCRRVAGQRVKIDIDADAAVEHGEQREQIVARRGLVDRDAHVRRADPPEVDLELAGQGVDDKQLPVPGQYLGSVA